VLGLSFTEILVIAIVALLAVGPQKLPGLLRTLGMWARKIRIMSTEMRAQSGIDDILRAEGLQGGINELRSLMRGQANMITSAVTTLPAVRKPIEAAPPPPAEPPPAPPTPAEPEPAEEDPYANLDVDTVRESPPEGPDSYGAIPDDLLDDGSVEPAPEPEPLAAAPEAAPEPPLAEPDTASPANTELASTEATSEATVPEATVPEAPPPEPPMTGTTEAVPAAPTEAPELTAAPRISEPNVPASQTTSHER